MGVFDIAEMVLRLYAANISPEEAKVLGEFKGQDSITEYVLPDSVNYKKRLDAIVDKVLPNSIKPSIRWKGEVTPYSEFSSNPYTIMILDKDIIIYKSGDNNFFVAFDRQTGASNYFMNKIPGRVDENLDQFLEDLMSGKKKQESPIYDKAISEIEEKIK